MKIVVLKFGGNSLDGGNKRRKVIKIIRTRLNEGYQPVIVVSAQGRRGDSYSTDTLIELLPSESSERHIALIASCGEMISAAVLAEELLRDGIPAEALTGWQAGLITDDRFTQSQVEEINISNIKNLLDKEKVPVICGFQGISFQGEITTLGRGGSDTTAALITRALQAERLELYKDVAGIFSADPAKVDEARLINNLDYYEIAELTGSGAKIIHNPAISQLSDHNIPLFLGDALTGRHGTCVQPCKSENLVTAITSRDKLILITLPTAPEHSLGEIFSHFARAGISLDFITVSSNQVSFVIDLEKELSVKQLLGKLSYEYIMRKVYCKITITGSGMTGQPGVMAKLCKRLEENNIRIELATDSYSTISCLVRQEDEIVSLNILHKAFDLQEEA
jgi:aspartate kinase